MEFTNDDDTPASHIAISTRTALVFNSLAIVAASLAALLPVGILAYWLLAKSIGIAQSSGLPQSIVGSPDLSQRLYATVLSLPACLPLSWGLLRLRVCFTEFGRGLPFSRAGIAGLRDFAVGTGLSAVGKIVSTALLSAFLSWSQPAGQRLLVINVGSDTLLLVVFAAVITAVSWAMSQAAAIAEENSQFV